MSHVMGVARIFRNRSSRPFQRITVSGMKTATTDAAMTTGNDQQPAAPRPLREIASYHAHVYYDPATTRADAERLRGWIADRFAVALGRWHDVEVGPHGQAMYQIAFAVEEFPALVPWLMINHGALSILVHPNTANPRRDHAADALWIGAPVAVHADILPEDSAAGAPYEPRPEALAHRHAPLAAASSLRLV